MKFGLTHLFDPVVQQAAERNKGVGDGPISLHDYIDWKGKKVMSWGFFADNPVDIAPEMRESGSLIPIKDGSRTLVMKYNEVLYCTNAVALVGEAKAVLERVRAEPNVALFVEKKISKAGRVYLRYRFGEANVQLTPSVAVQTSNPTQVYLKPALTQKQQVQLTAYARAQIEARMKAIEAALNTGSK